MPICLNHFEDIPEMILYLLMDPWLFYTLVIPRNCAIYLPGIPSTRKILPG